MMHMHGAQFSTAVQGRHRLAGVEQSRRIKGSFDSVKLAELSASELDAQKIPTKDGKGTWQHTTVKSILARV